MQRKSREPQVYESVKYTIMTEGCNKRDALHQYSLAPKFKICRTPIGQALSRLARKGYVTSYEGLIFSNVHKENEWT
ncbi:GntR family transcriptional regulator [Bacillus cereus]|uniref:GntR family transcriptional regulator n=1 Tax=Bacillus cereus TaxID=1396 RepID=UPI0018CDBBCB|nr:GntR family transcriptional regulator [Bacillus cereus]MBG9613497.1 hypothetical protein [Bacillus cereus]